MTLSPWWPRPCTTCLRRRISQTHRGAAWATPTSGRQDPFLRGIGEGVLLEGAEDLLGESWKRWEHVEKAQEDMVALFTKALGHGAQGCLGSPA